MHNAFQGRQIRCPCISKFYFFLCVARFWNSLLTSSITLMSKINEADLQLAHKNGSRTFKVLSALRKIPGADVHISATMGCSKINLSSFELSLREQTIRDWRDLDQINPHDAHVSRRVMRMYHTCFGVPIESGMIKHVQPNQLFLLIYD